jgi:hypothetical protein
MTTTAFCTVLRVTSADFSNNSEAAICLVHDMPNREVGGLVSTPGFRSVK